MHRSGTSALARVISLLGATLPKKIMAPSAANPRGYFESERLFELHEEIMRSAGTSWFELAPFPADWMNSPIAEGWVDRLAEALTAEFEDSPFFVLKDPRMSRLLPIWMRVFDRLDIEPNYVLAVRNPLEVAASLKKAEGIDESKGMLLWLQYFLAAEFRTRREVRCFVGYDDLLSDWRAVADHMTSSLNLVFPRRGRRAEAEVDSFLTRDLRHQTSEYDEVFARQDVSDWVKQAYAWANQAVSGCEEKAGRLDRIRRAFDLAEGVYGPIISGVELGKAQADRRAQQLENEALDLREGMSNSRLEIEELSTRLTEMPPQIALRSAEVFESSDWQSIREGDLDRLSELVKLILNAAIGRMDEDSIAELASGNRGSAVASLVEAGLFISQGPNEVGLLREDFDRLSEKVSSAAESMLALQPSTEVTAEASRLGVEVVGLRDAVSRRDVRIEQLKEQTEDAARINGPLKAEVEELKRALDANRTQITGLEEDLRRSSTELESLRTRLAIEDQGKLSMRQEFEELRSESSDRAEDVRRFEAEVAGLRNSIASRDAQVEELKEAKSDGLRKFETERLGLKQEIAGGQSEIERLAAELLSHADELKLRGEILASRDAQVEQLKAANADDLRTFGTERLGLKQEIAGGQSEIDRLEVELRSHADELKLRAETLSSRDAQVEELKGANTDVLRAFDTERLGLKQEIAGGQSQIDRLEAELLRGAGQLKLRAEALVTRDAQVEELKEANTDVLRRFGTERLGLKQEIAGGQSQIDRLEAELLHCTDELNSQAETVEAQEQQNVENLQLLGEGRRELMDLRVRVTSYDDKVAALRAEVRTVTADLSRANKDREQVEIRIRQFEGQREELSAANDQIAKMKLRSESLEQQKSSLVDQHAEEIAKARDEVADLSFCVDQLRTRLDTDPRPRRQRLINLMTHER
jgi:hypothetical protein